MFSVQFALRMYNELRLEEQSVRELRSVVMRCCREKLVDELRHRSGTNRKPLLSNGSEDVTLDTSNSELQNHELFQRFK
jgi:hypothetical protein